MLGNKTRKKKTLQYLLGECTWKSHCLSHLDSGIVWDVDSPTVGEGHIISKNNRHPGRRSGVNNVLTLHLVQTVARFGEDTVLCDPWSLHFVVHLPYNYALLFLQFSVACSFDQIALYHRRRGIATRRCRCSWDDDPLGRHSRCHVKQLRSAFFCFNAVIVGKRSFAGKSCS